MSTVLVRKDHKQGWKSAAKIVMKDSVERLKAWADGVNEELGWRKYDVAE